MLLSSSRSVSFPDIPSSLFCVGGTHASLARYRGKPVLLFFFSGTDRVSLEDLAYVERLYARYASFGLRVLGIHVPFYAFAQEEDFLMRLHAEHRLSFPLFLDGDLLLTKMHGIRIFPRVIVLDARGVPVYDHSGAGARAPLELVLQEELRKTGVLDLPALGPEHPVSGSVRYPEIPDVHLGFLRGGVVQEGEGFPGGEQAFTERAQDAQKPVTLHGHFFLRDTGVMHAREVSGYHEYLRLCYRAYRVFGVFSCEGSDPVWVRVRQHGLPLDARDWGSDIELFEGDTGFFVTHPRMYALVASPLYHAGDLQLFFSQKGISIHHFSFGTSLF